MPDALPCYNIFMKQVVIGIGGARSGAGKTHAAVEVIRALASEGLSVGAMKCEPDPLNASITDDPAFITEKGKDTALMKEAGAEEVLMVRAPREALKETLETAMDRLSPYDCAVVEGNSAVEALRGGHGDAIEVSGPCIVLFITGVQDAGPLEKQSAQRVLALSNVLIHGGTVPADAPEGVKKFSGGEPGAYTAHVISLIKGAQRDAR